MFPKARAKENIVIANPGKHHFYHIARAVQEVDHAYSFITGFYAKTSGCVYKSIEKKFSSEQIKERRESTLDERQVVSLWWLEGLYRTFQKSKIGKHLFKEIAYLRAFDLITSIHAKKSIIFHGSNGCCLRSLRTAKKNGAITILDQKTLHPIEWGKIVKEEEDRLGLSNSIFQPNSSQIASEECDVADIVFVPTLDVYKTCLLAGVPKDKIIIIPYGVDSSKFRPGLKSDSIFRILYVGNINAHKGLQYLLEAYREANIKDSELLLIGSIYEPFKRILSRYKGLFRHITYIPNSLLVDYYTNASIFVMPSLGESWGLATHEAMACGIPIVTTENARGCVEDNISGFVVPIKDAVALKEKIVYLYENKDLIKEMGAAARKAVETTSWENYRKRIFSVYQYILDEIREGRLPIDPTAASQYSESFHKTRESMQKASGS
jgi:glycosyltransferase involved in cell wall biosynthesis